MLHGVRAAWGLFACFTHSHSHSFKRMWLYLRCRQCCKCQALASSAGSLHITQSYRVAVMHECALHFGGCPALVCALGGTCCGGASKPTTAACKRTSGAPLQPLAQTVQEAYDSCIRVCVPQAGARHVRRGAQHGWVGVQLVHRSSCGACTQCTPVASAHRSGARRPAWLERGPAA